MKFYSRKLIRPEDLNANNTLFGGRLLSWIDEEAGIYAMSKIGSAKVVTKFMSEIDFVSSANQRDVIEIGLKFQEIGTTSITFSCEVRNLFTRETIITIDRIVFVNVNDENHPVSHGKTAEDVLKTAMFK
ncbi:MAG: acyl-CoA thioesterase [Flavobacteriales bacterium]